MTFPKKPNAYQFQPAALGLMGNSVAAAPIGLAAPIPDIYQMRGKTPYDANRTGHQPHCMPLSAGDSKVQPIDHDNLTTVFLNPQDYNINNLHIAHDPIQGQSFRRSIVETEQSSACFNLQFAKDWIHECDSSHGNHCYPAHDDSQKPPILLVDVLDACLTQPEQNKKYRYISLSYVWGKAESFKTTMATVHEFEKPGSLSQDDITNKIPKTILDAMEITALLGERFLWVDALCIVQDDEATKHQQLQGMGGIYQGAILTIAATQGWSADDGIHFRWDPETKDVGRDQDSEKDAVEESHGSPQHLKGMTTEIKNHQNKRATKWTKVKRWIRGTKTKNPTPNVENIPDPAKKPSQLPRTDIGPFKEYRLDNLVGDTFHRDLRSSAWSKRGWCLQELLHSKRILYFTTAGLLWECHCLRRHSQVPHCASFSHLPKQTYEKIPRPFHDTEWPDLELYSRAVLDYNHRQLTYDLDVLRAFAGVTGNLSSIFRGGFYFGLPIMFFDWTLLWQSDIKCSLRRRRAESPETEQSLPSWSWMGWQGNLDLASWASAYDYILPASKDDVSFPWNEQSFNTKPMVQWRFSGFENCYSTSEYRMHALCASDHSLDIPFGWRRRTDGSFQHDSDHTTLFRYPVPTINFLTTSPSSFIISGKVFRSYFTFNVAYWESLFGYRVMDEKGNFVGLVRPDFRLSNQNVNNQNCELIAISFGCILQNPGQRIFPELRRGDFFRGQTGQESIYKFYNVLWIEWKDGLACRKGLGRVEQKSWKDRRPRR